MNGIAGRPAWSSCYGCSPGLQPSPAEATLASRRRVTAPNLLNTVRTTAIASSTQAMRHTAKATTAARLLSTARNEPVTTMNAQSSVADAAQAKVQRSGRSSRPAVQGASNSTELTRQTASVPHGQTSAAARRRETRLPVDMPILVDRALVGQAATAEQSLFQERLSDVAEARQGRKGMAAKKTVPTRLQPLRQVNRRKS